VVGDVSEDVVDLLLEIPSGLRFTDMQIYGAREHKYIRPASGRTRDDGDDLLSTSGSQRYIDVPTRRKYKTEIKYLQDDTRTK